MNDHNPILLVEDDSVDAMMVSRALKELEVPNKLIHHENGENALDYLKTKGSENPCIILLDLNMPRMGGLEFLEIVKNDERLKTIPVIILTTSSELQDRLSSFSYSVAGYMVKPINYDEFVEMMKSISNYWSHSESPH